MSRLKAVALFLLLLWVPACGREIVEFETEPTAAPTVTSTLPARAATGVALDTSVVANFSQRMNGTTISDGTFTLRQGTTQVAGAVSMDAASDTATFRPSAALSPELIYTATVSADVSDTRGRALEASYVWSFTTIAAANIPDELPTVTSTTPAADAVDVALNIRPSATFSEAMDEATLNEATFTLRQGTTSIAGNVSLDAATNRAAFTPEAALGPGLVYTATITSAAHDSTGQGLLTDYVWSFTTTSTIGVPPIITATTPAENATLVAVGTVISATFDSPMDPATINDTTFTLSQVATRIEGTVSYDVATRTATFTPDAPPLAGGLTYTASVSTLVTDSAGVALAVTYTWEFGTAPVIVIDSPPTVSSTDPELNETAVAVDTSVVAVFSEAMAPATITDLTFTLREGVNDVPASVLYDANTNTATLTPNDDLDFELSYTASISTVVTDAAGTALEEAYTWNFSTAPAIIIGDPPEVSATDPESNELGVAVDATITATFDEAMAPETITDLTFTLREDGNDVPASVLYDADTNTATLTPDDDLDFGLTYTASISAVVTDAAGVALAEAYTWSFSTAGDLVAPTIVSTLPDEDAIEISVNTNVSVTFSERMEGSSLNDFTFMLLDGATQIGGDSSLNGPGTTVTFNPDAALDFDTVYTGFVSGLVTDASGNALLVPFTWTFTTGPDDVPPDVVSTVPIDGALLVSITDSISVTFDEAMAPASIDASFTLDDTDLNPVTGTVSLDVLGTTATFDPDQPLSFDSDYTASVNTLATDLEGNELQVTFLWSFTTEPPPPEVDANRPLDLAIDVSINTRPRATFSRAMDPATLDTDSFILVRGLDPTPIDGVVTYDPVSNTATFDPVAVLDLDQAYTATITTLATADDGTPLADDFSWTFTTSACSQEPVDLGDAGHFYALASSAVTSTGPTRISGDLGVSPGTAITGFPPGIVDGAQEAGTTPAADGILDLTVAFNNASGRVLCPVLDPGNVGGQTLFPGLYRSNTSMEISSGDLTLDALGDPDAVFIFQMASTLTTTPGRQVILAGGANPANIFWQVGSSATLGTDSVFFGTIMAEASVTLETRASLVGRALARTAAVNLDSNIIDLPPQP